MAFHAEKKTIEEAFREAAAQDPKVMGRVALLNELPKGESWTGIFIINPAMRNALSHATYVPTEAPTENYYQAHGSEPAQEHPAIAGPV